MDMIEVSSTDIASVGYEARLLHIRFHATGLYEFYDVPSYVFTELLSASSHGQYFHENIKNVYDYKKL